MRKKLLLTAAFIAVAVGSYILGTNNAKIPSNYVDTIEKFREYKVKHNLLVSCGDLLDILNFELWR